MSDTDQCLICAGTAPVTTLIELDASIVAVPEDGATVGWIWLIARTHVEEPFDLPGLQRRRYWEELTSAARALRDVTGAEGVAYSIDQDVTPHLHTTLVPRGVTRETTRAELAAAIDAGSPARSASAADAVAVYDEMSEWWDAQAEDGFYNAHYDRPTVLDLCGDVTGLRLADIGCGSGFYVAELAGRGAKVVGLDGSAEQLARARARVGPDVELIPHDLERPLTVLKDESFDGAVMPLVYHHIDNRVGLLSDVRRVLRPGGWMVLSTSHPTSDWLQSGGSYFAVERVEAFFDGPGGRWRVPFWRIPMGVLLDEILGAGFVLERLVEPVPPPDAVTVSPRMHRRLLLEPGFVALRARRPA